MATKLYPNRDYYMNWLIDTISLKGGWAATGFFLNRCHFSPVKENNSSGTTFSFSGATPPFRGPMHLGISPRLAAQTITGTINPLVFVSEPNLAYNCFLRMHVYVTVGDTDAVRGVLLNQFEDTANEFALSTPTAQRFSTAAALTPVAAQAGDRIAIELGFIQHAAGSGTQNIGRVTGTRYSTGDATVGSTTTSLNQYIEFSADLAFLPTTAVNDTCATATVVATFPYTTTVDTTNSATVNQPNRSGSCSNWGDDSLPVWWRIVVPAGNILHIHTAGSAYPTIVSLWTGSCAAPTHVACADEPTAEAPLVYGNTTGIDYYLLVNRDVYDDDENEVTGPGGLVSVSISVISSQPHGCTTPIPIAAIPYTSPPIDTTASGGDMTPELTCVDGQKHMQWFRYVPSLAHRLYVTAAGTTYDHGLAIFTGSCPNGPWTALVCRAGGGATPAQVAVQVTAGTVYWIVVAADDWDVDTPNVGGTLQLFAGDSHALGFIEPGQGGAVEWEGNYDYFACNGAPAFLQFLAPAGTQLCGMRLYEVGGCAEGDLGWTISVIRLEVFTYMTLPEIPKTAYVASPACGGGTYYGHHNQCEVPIPVDTFGDDFYATFGIRFRYGSRDTAVNQQLSDGYLEVRWRFTHDGPFQTYRWDNLLIGSGAAPWDGGLAFHPGIWTDRIYIRHIDEFCGWNPTAADLVWYRDFSVTGATNAELFTQYGGLFDRIWEYQGLYPSDPLPDAVRIDAVGRPTFTALDEDGDQYVSCFAQLRRSLPFPPYVPPVEPPTAPCTLGAFPVDVVSLTRRRRPRSSAPPSARGQGGRS